MFYDKTEKKVIKPPTLKIINHPLVLAICFGDDGFKEVDSY